MRSWVVACLQLCAFGFFKELRPSEPFFTPYLKNVKHLHDDQLENVYPYWTYSYLASLVLVFLLTDLLRYNPVIVFEGMAYVVTWALLIWGHSLESMQLMQVTYGIATATEIAYYSYIYAVVSTDQYSRVTSYTHSSLLTGRFVAALLGQLLISTEAATYTQLNIFSLSSVGLALVISLTLPGAKKSTYFNRTETGSVQYRTETRSVQNTPEPDIDRIPSITVTLADGDAAGEEATFSEVTATPLEDAASSVAMTVGEPAGKRCRLSLKQSLLGLLQDFVTCYSNRQLLKWSLWWAIATCGFFQVGNYVQLLWESIRPVDNTSSHTHDIYNGAVEAASTLLGALAAFSLQFLRVNWTLFGELTAAIGSLIQASLVFTMGVTHNIWIAYGFYIFFRSLYQFIITIAYFQIAVHLTTESYALVFGFNTFLALLLQTVLTVIFVDDTGLSLPANTQFQVYGAYFYLLGLIFTFQAVYSLTARGWRTSLKQFWQQQLKSPQTSGSRVEECERTADEDTSDTRALVEAT